MSLKYLSSEDYRVDKPHICSPDDGRVNCSLSYGSKVSTDKAPAQDWQIYICFNPTGYIYHGNDVMALTNY